MKPKTAKRLAILIALLSMVGGTGFFTQRFQVNRLAARELAKADLASSEGDFVRAATLYRGIMEQRLPGNQEEIEIKYAKTLLKLSHSTRSQFEAAGIYQEILRKSGGREDVRKLLLDLKFEMRQFVSSRGAEKRR